MEVMKTLPEMYDELAAENERLRDKVEYLEKGIGEWRDEALRLRNHLHRISLASQNSMSSQAECGRIAREALEGK